MASLTNPLRLLRYTFVSELFGSVLKISRLPPGYTATLQSSSRTRDAVVRPASTAPIQRQISRHPGTA
eukprot:30899-Pelagococcus_subviridis.AAC.17